VTKGSAHFFYDDVNALCASLKGLIDEEFLLRAPPTHTVSSWQELVRLLFDRVTAFLEKDPTACQLAVGVDASPALKLMSGETTLSWVESSPNRSHSGLYFTGDRLRTSSGTGFLAVVKPTGVSRWYRRGIGRQPSGRMRPADRRPSFRP
jgi:hypothetical protein